MSDILLIIAGFSLFAFLASFIGVIIQLVRHKSKKVATLLCIIFLIIFVTFEGIGIALKCDHNYVLTNQVEATCLSEGTNSYQCEDCGETKSETIPALQHNLSESTQQNTNTEGLIIYSCTRCEYTENVTVSTIETPEESLPISTTIDTSKIEVSFEPDSIDSDKLYLKVFITNHSDQIFTGDISVTFYGKDLKNRLGSDMILIDKLQPGRNSWANIAVDAYLGTPQMLVSFSDASFTPVESITSDIDEEATKKTFESFKWNFSDVSWFNDVIDISVYTDGNCTATISPNAKETSQFYASAIWGCASNHDVTSIRIINQEGAILSVYP